jgi:HSP20 family protein
MSNIERTIPDTGQVSAERKESTRQEERYAMPPVDIYEKEDALMVLADLPGVTSKGLSISVENGILTIMGKVEHGAAEDVIGKEFDLNSFYRQFRISETIDTGKIKANLKNGVLTLSLPKVEKAKPRQIPVESS